MEYSQEAKQLINDSKNIYIIPSENDKGESIASALALFYTLKELNKNVNLIIGDIPENLKFLIPSADFISYPKNFVISIPNEVANISQIFYEKNDNDLKIHLTLDRGNIKKDNISFYFSETKPDLVITLGIKDYQAYLQNKLNSFGFLLDSPVINIDTLISPEPNGQDTLTESVQENKKFGRINIIEDSSLSEIALRLAANPHSDSIKKEPATCFLTGIAIYTENFGNAKTTQEIFEIASLLMKKGAYLNEIRNNLYK